MQNTEFKQGMLLGLLVGVGASYLVYSNRRQIKAKVWKLKARADLHRRLSNLKKITKKEYEEIVENVTDKYRDVSDIAADEINDFADELKDRWSSVKARFEDAAEALAD